jgi:hypothetical protein
MVRIANLIENEFGQLRNLSTNFVGLASSQISVG